VQRLAAVRDVFVLTVFLASLAAFMTVVPFGDFDTIIGDNIAQVGYWRILVNHAFVGGLGASSMKPGLIVLLGATHDLSLALFGSTVLIKVVFALAGAGLATIVACIARQGAGTVAGVGAVIYLMTRTPVPAMFVDGTSMLVFLPLLLWGVWLFSVGSERAGAIVLCLAALIRIEAFAVLLWLALAEQLFKRRWRAFSFSTVVVTITVLITGFTYYRLQGSVARFNAGGPGAGYVFSHEPSAWIRTLGALRYPFSAAAAMAFEQCRAPYLGVPALLGCALSPGRRSYLALLGIPLFLMVYVSTGQGYGEVRYFQFLAPVVAALGAAGLVHAFRMGGHARAPARTWPLLLAALAGLSCLVFAESKPVGSLSLIFIAAGLGALLHKLSIAPASRLLRTSGALLSWVVLLRTIGNSDWGSVISRLAYTVDAQNLLKHSPVPKGQRVLTEDDLIYGVLINDMTLFRAVAALQYFNVQSDARRAEMLGATDYIIASKHNYGTYYLKYDPLGRGTSDPFRAAVVGARKGKPTSLYGYRLVPIETSRDWTVIKVESGQGPG